MPRDRRGEHIGLYEGNDGGEYTDEFYVRGHVDEPTFRAAVAGWLDDETPETGPIRHVWARWEFSGRSEYGSAYRTLAEHKTPARGCFPVTAATDAGRLRRAAGIRAQEDRDAAELLARYPGATVTSRNGYGRDYQIVVPGCVVSVRVGWRDWRPYHERRGKPERVTLAVWPTGRDVAAWEAFLATCPDYEEVTRG